MIAMGLLDRFPCGRPPRIPDWLRRTVLSAAEAELDGLNLTTIMATESPFDEMTDAAKLADADQLGVALLADILRPAVGFRDRNKIAIRIAQGLADTRYTRVKRGEKKRTPLDVLIEDVAAR